MVKAKELRLGNWVRLYAITQEFADGTAIEIAPSIVAPITSIQEDNTIRLKYEDATHKNFSGGSIGCYKVSMIEGIPLVEEWLERFGFEKKSTKTFETGYSYGHGFIVFRIMLHDKGFWAILQEHEKGINFGKDYQYVHQLQNIYFALTGDELELKEVAATQSPL